MRNSLQTIMVACLSLASSASVAADAVSGWGLQFHRDLFNDRTFPTAMMQETTEGIAFDQANLFLVCVKNEVRVMFQPERLLFNDTVQGDFRGPDGVVSATFAPVEVDGLGRYRVASGDASAALITIFAGASASVPFQSGDKKGTFPVIGFNEVLAIMDGHCGPPDSQ